MSSEASHNAAQKRKRTDLSLNDKLNIIQAVESGKSSRQEISVKYDLGKTTVGDIIRSKHKILAKAEEIGRVASKSVVRERNGLLPSLEAVLLNWFTNARAGNIPIQENTLQHKASLLAKMTLQSIERPLTEDGTEFEAALQNFRASNGWLAGFKKRFNIKSMKVSGEGAAVSEDIAQACRDKVQRELDGYALRDIFNCDETALFWKCLPDRTLQRLGQKCSGGKVAKDRITVLLCANADGSEKRKPLIIGKYQKPRCFKSVKPQSLGVDYCANKNAWMTGVLFQNWLQAWDAELDRRGRKIALVLDNASSHSRSESYRNIQLIPLVANTTSVCQPMDQGIIRLMKVFYRKWVLGEHIRAFDENKLPQLSLYQCFEWLVAAWDAINPEAVENCFRKSGILVCPDRQAEQTSTAAVEDITAEVEKELEGIDGNTFMDEFFDFDRYEATEPVNTTDSELVQEILFESGLHREEEPAVGEQLIQITDDEGIVTLKRTISYLEQNLTQYRIKSEHLAPIKRALADAQTARTLRHNAALKQSKITAFLQKK
jgi:hypothetical protein